VNLIRRGGADEGDGEIEPAVPGQILVGRDGSSGTRTVLAGVGIGHVMLSCLQVAEMETSTS
jgi:hypothetical protein